MKKHHTMPDSPLTIAHVTHEAIEHVGGIGTVLQGLITSPAYQKQVGRTVLIGPTAAGAELDPEDRLGEGGQVIYSSADGIDRRGMGDKLRPIEWSFNVSIVYGTREFVVPQTDRRGIAEVLLIDVFNINQDRVNAFKHRLWDRLSIDCAAHEQHWEFEEYVRLAEPAYYALQALLQEKDYPCVLIAHEFMGLPAAFQAILEDHHQKFRTVFHAHECATARYLVEHNAGHDTMFYNVLDKARAQNLYVEDVFGDMDWFFRHALVSKAHLCDATMAVGKATRDELQFLNREYDQREVDLVFNGVPHLEADAVSKKNSRSMLLDYAEQLLGHEPDVLLTHVARPVISKGMWRDLKVCHHLDALLAEKKKTGVLFLLTTGGGVRSQAQVERMEAEYGWPRHHRQGYPDLSGPEVELDRDIAQFNAHHRHMQVVLVNQFGWSPQRIGKRLPAMDIADLRRAADVELGMATYEPFGISPLEPLGGGAICVISNVCGCEAFAEQAAGGRKYPNLVVAGFTQLDKPEPLDHLLKMDQAKRDRIEDRVSAQVAGQIVKQLAYSDKKREKLVQSGQQLAGKLSWDHVVSDAFLPVMRRVAREPLVRSARS